MAITYDAANLPVGTPVSTNLYSFDRTKMKEQFSDKFTNKQGQKVLHSEYTLEGGTDGHLTNLVIEVITDKPLTKAQVASGVIQMVHTSIKITTMLLERDSVEETVKDIAEVSAIFAYNIPYRPEITLATGFWAFMDGCYTMFWSSVSSGTRTTTVQESLRSGNSKISW